MCLCFIKKLFAGKAVQNKKGVGNYTAPRLPDSGAAGFVYNDPSVIYGATAAKPIMVNRQTERAPVYVENIAPVSAVNGLMFESIHVVGATKMRKMEIDNG